MSHAEQGAARHRSWRLLIVGIGVGLAGCALSLIMQTSSASASEPADDGAGVLGLVGSTLTAVGAVADDTLAIADIPAPGSVAQVLAPVATVVEGLDRTAAHAVNTVSHTLASGATTNTVELLGSVPVVGAITDRLGVTDALTGITRPLDRLLTQVVGSTTLDADGVLPSLALASLDLIRGVPLASPTAVDAIIPSVIAAPATPLAALSVPAVVLGGSIAAAVALALTSPFGAPLPQNRGSTGPVSAFSGSSGQMPVAVLPRSPLPAPRASARASRSSDDALPGAPVFDTDISPD